MRIIKEECTMTLTANPVSTTSFGTMEDRQKLLKKKRLKDFLNIGMIATAFFIVADFVPLYIKWTAVQTDNWYFVALLAAVSAVVLDLPMFLAGKKIKEYQDGLISKNKMIPTVVLEEEYNKDNKNKRISIRRP